MKKLLLASVAIFGFASAVNAADLPSRYAPPPVVAAVPVFTWTGFYVGVNAGYGWATNDSNNSYYDPILGYSVGGSSSDGGFLGGGQVGYNYQFGQFVVGVETDIQYADLGGSNGGYGGYYGSSSSDGYFGTVRARAGFAFDRALIYATGGFAYGDIGNNGFLGNNLGYYGSSDSTNTGWVLGGGLEYAFTDNLTAKLEGLYVNLGSNNNGYYGTLPVASYVNNNQDNEFGVVRAGLNYKFTSY